MVDQQTAQRISENLSLAFDHLREAILLALAGPPTEQVLAEEAFLAQYSTAVEEIKNGPGTVQEKADRIAQVMLDLTATIVADEQTEQERLFPTEPDAPLTLREYEQAAVDLSSALAQDDEDHSVKAGEEIGGAAGRLERFIESDGDTDVLTEGLHKPEDAPGVESGEHPGLTFDDEEEEEDDFSALFDVDEDDDPEPPDEGSPPAAF